MTIATLRKMQRQVDAAAYAEIRKRAEKIMRDRPNIRCFCMAMGAAAFYDEHGPMSDQGCMLPLFDLANEFNMLGSPLRLDKRVDGSIAFTRDW